MVKYFCEKCGKSFPTPSKLKRHNERKTPCFSVDKKKPSKTLKNPQFTSITLNNPQNGQMTVKTNNCSEASLKCEYCNKIIPHIKNYKRHLRTSCEEIPLSKRKLLLEKYNKNKNHINQ